MIMFLWLIWKNKNITWDNLQKRNQQGPGICYLYWNEGEDNNHLLLKCPYSVRIWRYFTVKIGTPCIQYVNIFDCLYWWSEQCITWRLLPVAVFWEIWRWWDQIIFENCKVKEVMVMDRITKWISDDYVQNRVPRKKTCRRTGPAQALYVRWGFLMGHPKEGCVVVVFGSSF